LKGLGLQIGAMDLALLCGRIEAASEGGDVKGGAALLDATEVAFEALQRALTQHNRNFNLVETQVNRELQRDTLTR
jgi:hypothetical protein